ncbi:Hypothetical predicted protein [Paramuricea clavata]|uniref:Uncharacterized protein n=1 Tax=Paramuricea clavata TaxID=317549 RepID=A0A7D9DY29_PARCT|nr:Hypothetical predicted protein [Paramuricea clavata]
MADKSEINQVQVTSEKKKDPRRVEAGKRLAAISKIAKDRKKKKLEDQEFTTSNSTLVIAGLIVAVITLFITYKMNRREEKALEPKIEPDTVTIERRHDTSNVDSLE